MFALSSADSRSLPGGETGGFLYSSYLSESSLTLENDFSVETGSRIWGEALSRAGSELDSISLTDYMARELINEEGSALEGLEDELSRKGWRLGADMIEVGVETAAEEALGRSFRRVDMNIETGTGLGISYAGLGVIGSLHESEETAASWQLQAYSGFENERKGGSFGLLMRSVSEGEGASDILIGGNFFFDYETYGGESLMRWSAGAEMRSEWVDVFANRYISLDETLLTLSDGARIYSSSGYDIEMHLHSPRLPVLTGILGYYFWEGEHEQEDDSGLLAGVRMSPWQLPLKFQLEYRSGEGETFGGGISFTHDFSRKRQGSNRSKEIFRPRNYFYASAEREYSQHIVRIEPPADPRIFGVAHQIDGLEGLARLRSIRDDVELTLTTISGLSVTMTRVITTDITTNLGLSGSGELVSLDGTLESYRGRQTPSSISTLAAVPYFLPPGTLYFDTFANSTLELGWRQGSGTDSVVYSNSRVYVAPNAMRVIEGSAEVSAERGFFFDAPVNNVTIALNGGGDIKVDDTDGGMVSVSGRFMMNVGEASYSNDGHRSAGISLAFAPSGLVTLERAMSGGVIYERDGARVTILPPDELEAFIIPVSTFFGSLQVIQQDGLTPETAFVLPTGFAGLVAAVYPIGGFRGEYDVVAVTTRHFTLADNGALVAPSPLVPGPYSMAFTVSRGVESTVTTLHFLVGTIEPLGPVAPVTMVTPITSIIDVTMGATMFQQTDGLRIEVASGLPVVGDVATLDMITVGVEYGFGGILATVTGWPAFLNETANSLSVSSLGVVSAAERLIGGRMYTITVRAVVEDVEIQTATLVVSVMPVNTLNFELAAGLTGDGTPASPAVLPFGHEGIIATVTGWNEFEITSANSLTLGATGLVSAAEGLDVGTYMITVQAVLGDIDVVAVPLAVTVTPWTITGITSSLSGAGTQSSPYSVADSDGFLEDAEVARFTHDGAPDVEYQYQVIGQSGIFFDIEDGVLSVADTLVEAETYVLTVFIERHFPSTTVTLSHTLHVETVTLPLRPFFVTELEGEGTEASPYLITTAALAEPGAAGAVLGNADALGGGGTGYNYSFVGASSEFVIGINTGVIRVTATLSETARYSVTVAVSVASNLSTLTVHFRTILPVLPLSIDGIDVASEFISGTGTEDDPVITAPLEHEQLVVRTFLTSGGPRGQTVVLSGTSSANFAVALDQGTGIQVGVSGSGPVPPPGDYQVTVQASVADMIALYTVHLRIQPPYEPVVDSPSSSSPDDGISSQTPLLIEDAQFTVPGAVIGRVRAVEGTGAPIGLIAYEDVTFGEISIMRDGSLVANTELMPAASYEAGARLLLGIEGEIFLTLTIHITTAASFNFGGFVESSYGGAGTSQDPFIIGLEDGFAVGSSLAMVTVVGDAANNRTYSTNSSQIGVAGVATGGATLTVIQSLAVGQDYTVEVTVESGSDRTVITAYFRTPSVLELDVEVISIGNSFSDNTFICNRAGATHCYRAARLTVNAPVFQFDVVSGFSGTDQWVLSGRDSDLFVVDANGMLSINPNNVNLAGSDNRVLINTSTLPVAGGIGSNRAADHGAPDGYQFTITLTRGSQTWSMDINLFIHPRS